MRPYLRFLKREEASAVERLMGADSALSNIPKPEVYSFLCWITKKQMYQENLQLPILLYLTLSSW